MLSRIYTGTALIFVSMVALVASAQAIPAVDVTGPITGQCIGGPNQKIEGTISSPLWNASSYVARTVQRDDTGEILWSNQTPYAPVLGEFDTRSLPVGVDLDLTVLVHAPDGNAADTLTFRPQFDRTNPTEPRMENVLAVSGNEVLIQYSGASDLGCSGGIKRLQTLARDAHGLPLVGLGDTDGVFTDRNGISNGPSHDTLSPRVLSLCQNYSAQAGAVDKTDNESWGNNLTFSTPCNANATVAGQVKSVVGTKVNMDKNVLVTATHAGSAPVSAMSDANGWYRLSLDQGNWTLSYATGCSLRFYCDPVVSATDSVDTNGQSAAIVLKHKTLQGG